MDAFKKVLATLGGFWASMPRKLKYFLLGLALAGFEKRFPGVLPSVDPTWYVGGGLALAAMHTVTDATAAFNGANNA